MAKIPFSKLKLTKKEDIKEITINDIVVEVKQYLPVNDKLTLIGNVISFAADENNFSNPIKLDVFTALEIVFTYTNLSFTEKQKEDLVKLYDIMESNGVFDTIIAAIPKVEYKSIIEGVQECSNAIYTYRNSALGIMDSIAQDYSNLDLDATKIQEKLADAENIEFLKQVMSKMG